MLTISVTVHDDDPDHAARELGRELLALDVEDLTFAQGETAPANAKGMDAASVTTIVVALAGSPILKQLGLVLRDWVGRERHRKVVVKEGDRSVEISGSLGAAEQQVVNAFFDRPGRVGPSREL